MIHKLKEKFIDDYCNKKRYSVQKTSAIGKLRIDVSNLKEKINITLYDTGTLVVGGKPSYVLKDEFESLKNQIEEHPEMLGDVNKFKIKSCASKYNILLTEIRNKIKDSLPIITKNVELTIDPTPSEEYRAKLSKDKMFLSLTQYKNGTLFLQGKEDLLYNDTCDAIEMIATPSDQEVIIRFIAGNDEAIEKFSGLYTPKLTEQANAALKSKILEVYSFLEPHDLKWLVASESLRIVNVPLPEYSPIVMPASKAFEGFCKKLLVSIGFYPSDYFKNKVNGFRDLMNKKNPERLRLESIEKHAGTYLEKIDVYLDTNRNFIMHSDESAITQIDKFEDASKKLDEIYGDMDEIYQYFKKAGLGIS